MIFRNYNDFSQSSPKGRERENPWRTVGLASTPVPEFIGTPNKKIYEIGVDGTIRERKM
jgi:hypothetical protein